jgi:hypothetical protein
MVAVVTITVLAEAAALTMDVVVVGVIVMEETPLARFREEVLRRGEGEALLVVVEEGWASEEGRRGVGREGRGKAASQEQLLLYSPGFRSVLLWQEERHGPCTLIVNTATRELDSGMRITLLAGSLDELETVADGSCSERGRRFRL